MIRFAVVLVLIAGCGKGSHDRARSSNGSATAHHEDEQIEAFWTWFSQHAAEMKADPDLVKVVREVGEQLTKLHPGLIGEISDGDPRTFVLSADGNRDLFPQVQSIYAARPARIEGWKVVAFRQRDMPNDRMTLELKGQKVAPTNVKFVSTAADHKLDIVVYIPGFTTAEEMGSIGFILLDHTVGEYDMETKIAAVDFAALDKAPANAEPLTELPARVDALK